MRERDSHSIIRATSASRGGKVPAVLLKSRSSYVNKCTRIPDSVHVCCQSQAERRQLTASPTHAPRRPYRRRSTGLWTDTRMTSMQSNWGHFITLSSPFRRSCHSLSPALCLSMRFGNALTHRGTTRLETRLTKMTVTSNDGKNMH